MVEMHAESRWGSKFYENLSKDLASAMPDQKSFLPTNLKYMTYFYQLYSENSPQVVDELCSVPWGHHRYIIDKCKGNTERAFLCKKDDKKQLVKSSIA